MDFVTERLFQWAKETPDKKALIDANRSVSYFELASAVYGVSKALNSLGVQCGDAILLEAVPKTDFAILCYGIHLFGGIHVPVENRIPDERLAEIAERVDGKLIVSTHNPNCGVKQVSLEQLLAMAEEYKSSFTIETVINFPNPTQRGEILFTTGSTGRSKGVVQTRAAISCYLDAMNTSLSMHPGTVLVVVTPMNHAGGLHRMHMTLHCGGTLVIMDGMTNLKAYYEAIYAYNVNTLYLPPSGVHILLLFSAKELAKLDGKLDFIFTASAPFPQGDREKMRQLLPNTRLIEAYGGSEVGSVCNCNYNAPDYIPGCMGKPYPCVEIRITGEDNLISIRSPMLMEEYLNDPELTASVLQDGWFQTSDCGRIDEQGRLHFLGRNDDVINIGGKKVAPTELEEAAMRCSGIADCVCVSEADDVAGTVLCLLVVPTSEEDFSPKKLVNELRGKVEDYKLPTRVRIIDKVPRFPNGKIDRKKLRSAK